jgi:uncharacterized protein
MAALRGQNWSMKFQPETFANANAITRVEPGAVWVNAVRHDASLIVPWQGEVTAWSVAAFEALAEAHFEPLVAFAPELVIFGSGSRLRFASPALHRTLIEARIGIETMDTAAACRTYNVLAAEGRRVIAALMLEAPA